MCKRTCIYLSLLASSWLVSLSECQGPRMFQFSDDSVQCPITGLEFAAAYTAMVEDMAIADPETGEYCSVSVDQDGNMYQDYAVCETLLSFSQRLLVDLNATQDCCLRNISSCEDSSSDTDDKLVDRTKAYGYGTLMVMLLSLLSLLGIIVLPLLRENTKLGRYYEHFNLFMISLGTSALFSDAVLHLLPQTFGLQHHRYQVSDEQEMVEDRCEIAVLWKACAVVGGMYLFYLFELLLCWLTGRNHSHDVNDTKEAANHHSDDPSQLLIKDRHQSASACNRPTESSELSLSDHENIDYKGTGCYYKIEPLAVLIICGDAFHNFTDGIALGASMSQSLALGISTAIALVFHEIPHELGNFAILLSTGMRWPVVLLFNFISSLTALVGFFIGVSVGIVSSEGNTWMLALAAGTFLYVALVDLLPLILHSKLRGCMGILLSNIGFIISFTILLVIALYEDVMDTLITAHL